MRKPLTGKEKNRLMLAFVLAFILCASVVSAFAADEMVNGTGTEQTESTVIEEPVQTTGPAQSDRDSEQADVTEQKKETAVKAAPDLRSSYEAVIEYESRSIAKSRQFWSKDGEYIGCCCQAGPEPSDSGTAAMSRVANTSLVARIAYYYGSQKDWVHDYNVISGFQQHTNAARFMYMVQMSQQGTETWKSWATSNNFSKKIREDAVSCFEEAQELEITVPDGFECYICSPVNGSQKFILFKYSEETAPGAVTMRKISGNTDITG